MIKFSKSSHFTKSSGLFILFSVFSLCFIISCSKKDESVAEPAPVVEIKKTNHNWYCFNSGKIQQIKKPAEAPYIPQKPYTEAVRISCSSTASDSSGSSEMQKITKAYSVVNQTGLITYENEDFKLSSDASLFNSRTAENLVFYENVPVLGLYKNSFFNISFKKEKNSPFLIQMNPETNVFYQILNVQNLTDNDTDQITDFIWDGNNWSCCIKTSMVNKTDFKYVTFQPKDPLLSITPQSAGNKILISKNSQSEFRKAKSPSDISKAPELLQNLLRSVPSKIDYEITLYTAGGHSPENFRKGNENSRNLMTVQAIISDSWICALFPDGTMYLNGALHNGSLINKGKTCGIKLPKIPAGFYYTGFAISDSTLYVSWEESDFYNTGKAGFLQILLGNVLKKAGLYSGSLKDSEQL